ncbi:MAG: hypothetical protein IT260_09325 [Saprospiraceae bacterium]|nr:hypothetical protein [Saprospiraceae bacterium]
MDRSARIFLEAEALSLRTRLEQVKPFSLTMPMVAAASISDAAFRAVTDHLLLSTRKLRQQVEQFLRYLHQPETAQTSDEELQARYATLKLRFNAILDQFDIFADVISQRAEHHTGVWIAGLDVLAADALQLPGHFYEAPPLMCFLERGHGAAIRRARTRLPGGDTNPVAIIQVPRERMVGSGIASSLVHEVGHQGAALLDLVATLRDEMQHTALPAGQQRAWNLLSLWISEIIADFWAMAQLGIGATLGLMNVVSLPRYFMFRVRGTDPHPFPWIRVELSLAFGKRLYPHEQWDALRRLWHRLYPTADLPEETRAIIDELLACLPRFVELVCTHHNQHTQGQPLLSLFPVVERQPARLRALYRSWRQEPASLPFHQPSLVFAVVGQARADAAITASEEGRLLGRLLAHWAWMRAEDRSGASAGFLPAMPATRTFIH